MVYFLLSFSHCNLTKPHRISGYLSPSCLARDHVSFSADHFVPIGVEMRSGFVTFGVSSQQYGIANFKCHSLRVGCSVMRLCLNPLFSTYLRNVTELNGLPLSDFMTSGVPKMDRTLSTRYHSIFLNLGI